jgi:hypothetical protein
VSVLPSAAARRLRTWLLRSFRTTANAADPATAAAPRGEDARPTMEPTPWNAAPNPHDLLSAPAGTPSAAALGTSMFTSCIVTHEEPAAGADRGLQPLASSTVGVAKTSFDGGESLRRPMIPRSQRRRFIPAGEGPLRSCVRPAAAFPVQAVPPHWTPQLAGHETIRSSWLVLLGAGNVPGYRDDVLDATPRIDIQQLHRARSGHPPQRGEDC